jgi:hypothetical protein
MNRFIKVLIIVNGILIPLIIAFFFLQYIKTFSVEEEESEGIIVGEQHNKAINDSIALQRILCGSFEEIYNSNNLYLSVSVTSYDEALDMKKMASSAGDISFFSLAQNINVIFLDNDYNVIGTLVDKKASIKEINVPHGDYGNNKIDKTVNNIAYLIGFDDSNKNGKIDKDDYHDLYITDLNGKNLTKVTENVDVESFYFTHSHSQIFISFQERNGLREEYRKTRFAIYNIETQTFKQLLSLNEKLDQLEKKIIF